MENNNVSIHVFEKHKEKCGLSFDGIVKEITELKKENAKLNKAMFSDKDFPEGPDNLGMQKMVIEMHSVFCSTGMGLKIVKYTFLVAVVISAGVLGFIKLFKELRF